MHTQKMQQQIELITQRENIPESLACLCKLFLSTLENLKGTLSDASFLETLDKECSKLEAETEKSRIATVLDVLLTASIYFKKAHTYFHQPKKYQPEFGLLLWDIYNQLMDWFEEEMNDHFDRIDFSDNFFEQFSLESKRTRFSRLNLWRDIIRQYQIVAKYGLTCSDSLLKDTFDKYQKELYIFSHPLIAYIHFLVSSLVFISGGYLLLGILHLFYQFYVIKPYILLLAGAGLKKYRTTLGELSIARHSFWERGISIFGTSEPIYIFLLGIIFWQIIDFFQDIRLNKVLPNYKN